MARPVLAVDLGTSSAKAGLVDLTGAILRRASAAYPPAKRDRGLSVRDPEDWWRATVEAVRGLHLDGRRGLGTTSGVDVEAVAVCGVTLAPIFLDALGSALGPTILWDDSRGEVEARELVKLNPGDTLLGILGASFPPSSAWPIPRLLWIARHAPEVLSRIAHVLQPKDLVNRRLTGSLASDVPSQRGLANQLTGRYDMDGLASLGVPSLQTRLLAPAEVLGPLLPEPAALLGLPDGIPVLAGTHDFTAALLGLGPVEDGDAVHIAGTSDHVGLYLPGGPQALRRVDPLTLAPDATGQMLLYGVVSSGGGAAEWAVGILAAHVGQADADDALASPAPDAPLFAPYLQGARTPFWDPWAAGAFVGLRAHHRASDLLYAVLEGVAFALREILEGLERTAGARVKAVRAAGGPTRVRAWNRLKAAVLDRPLRVSREPDAGLLGCAMLAFLALGHAPSLAAARELLAPRYDEMEPSALPGGSGGEATGSGTGGKTVSRDWLEDRYHRHVRLYGILKELR